ncbi:uncharacterized protein K444DRAFT_662754 [Hyaloscypha bicolor E]|uniref:Uncharacterized protein n=1 Tax=Hyaloscypha bicolor E TaxID=1095630 RepID=A0A2J6TFI6_9HELO|nr:uncharacterized protein K444DRAFT_662754 [Hyaloscypha bicolor E]PMD61763.1 hypothetical protein K444DRAFT_662754 [Hyaloscypha bicolor E]
MNSQKPDEDSYHQYATPTSTLSSGYGNYYGGFRHEDDLPENSKGSISKSKNPNIPLYTTIHPKPLFLPRSPPPSALPATTAVERAPEAGRPPVEEKKIWGLKRRMFFIILAVILVVVAIAVGGGVGGAMASKSKSKSKSAADSAPAVSTSSGALSGTQTQAPATVSPSSTAATNSGVSGSTTTTSSSPSSSTSPLTFLNNETTPSASFAFQGFAAANYLGDATSIIHSEGGTNFSFQLNSYVWLPNATSCVGWWCDERYRPSASGSFGRIFVWCGKTQDDANALVGGVGFDILEKGWLAVSGKLFFGGGMARQYGFEKSSGGSLTRQPPKFLTSPGSPLLTTSPLPRTRAIPNYPSQRSKPQASRLGKSEIQGLPLK